MKSITVKTLENIEEEKREANTRVTTPTRTAADSSDVIMSGE